MKPQFEYTTSQELQNLVTYWRKYSPLKFSAGNRIQPNSVIAKIRGVSIFARYSRDFVITANVYVINWSFGTKKWTFLSYGYWLEYGLLLFKLLQSNWGLPIWTLLHWIDYSFGWLLCTALSLSKWVLASIPQKTCFVFGIKNASNFIKKLWFFCLEWRGETLESLATHFWQCC